MSFRSTVILAFDRKLFSKNGHLIESSFDRKLFFRKFVIWPKDDLTDSSFDPKLFSKNGI
jgi:hypothetical protein